MQHDKVGVLCLTTMIRDKKTDSKGQQAIEVRRKG